MEDVASVSSSGVLLHRGLEADDLWRDQDAECLPTSLVVDQIRSLSRVPGDDFASDVAELDGHEVMGEGQVDVVVHPQDRARRAFEARCAVAARSSLFRHARPLQEVPPQRLIKLLLVAFWG